MLCTFRTSPSHIILGGDIQIWRENKTRYTALEAFESVFSFLQKKYIEEDGFSSTANMATRCIDFNKIGPFGGIELAEDMEWGRRACAAGFVFRYIPEMIVFHPARRSIRALFAKWDRHIHHYLNMTREKRLWRFRWLARAIMVFVSPALLWTKIIASDRISGKFARIKAFGVLVVLRLHYAWKMIRLLFSEDVVVWNRE